MKNYFLKILGGIALIALMSNDVSAQRTWTTEAMGYGTQRTWVYKPSAPSSSVVLYFHGDGQKGSDINLVDNEGLPRYVSQGMDLKMNMLAPQLPDVSIYNDNFITASVDYAYAQGYTTVYAAGYSLGASGLLAWAKKNPGRIAGIILVAGAYDAVTADVDSLAKIPIYFVTGTGDTRQNISNPRKMMDSLCNPNHTLTYLPETDFPFGTVHGDIDEYVFSKFDSKWQNWLLLHHKNADTTAKRYVDSLERGFDYNFWKKTVRLVNNLSSGSFKTGLLSRIAAAENTRFGVGHKTAVIDLGNSAQTTSGVNNLTSSSTNASIANLIDGTGANTNWMFTIAATASTTIRNYTPENAGITGGYFNQPITVWRDGAAIWDNPNSSSWRFSGLNNSKQYIIRMTGTSRAALSGTIQAGFIATVTSSASASPTIDTVDQQYYNTNKYVEFTVQPTGGQVTINLKGYMDNSEGIVGLIEITEKGTGSVNNPPVSNAGTDRTITHATTSLSVSGSGSTDSDGSITGYLWTQVSGPATASFGTATSVSTTISNLTTVGTYVFRLEVTDNSGDKDFDEMTVTVNPASSPLLVSAGADKWMPWNQSDNTPPFGVKALVTSGAATSYTWSVQSGPSSLTIGGQGTDTATFTGAKKGVYTIRITVSDGVNSAYDEMTMNVRDLMNRTELTCRSGAPQSFLIANTTSSTVTTTTASYNWVMRDNRIPGLQGGDTIKIASNPNHPQGIWQAFSIGDIRAPKGCPVIIVPNDTLLRISGGSVNFGMFLANQDSNVLSNVIFDGTIRRESKGIVYGFQLGNPDSTADKFMYRGIAGNLLHHVTFKGFWIENVGTAIDIKIKSDSSKPFRYYDNFRMTGNRFEHIAIKRTVNEGIYFGHTDPPGATQAGNTGPVPKIDSTFFNYLYIDSTGWDGMQFSWGGYAEVKNALIRRTGAEKIDIQSYSLLFGSWTQGLADSVMMTNGYGGFGFLGEKKTILRNSIGDSINTAILSQAVVAGLPHPDTLQVDVRGNIFTRGYSPNEQIRVSNDSPLGEYFKAGTIRNNTFESARSISQLVTSAYGDTITNNTIVQQVNLDTAALAVSLPAYTLYKIITNPFNKIAQPSFFDAIQPRENMPPTVAISDSQTLRLPDNAVNITVIASDEDGAVVSYLWEKVSGPGNPSFSSTSNPSVRVTGLVQGKYIFRVTVKDNDGGEVVVDAKVTVLAVGRFPRTLSPRREMILRIKK